MSPYERTWRRAHRTNKPALYFNIGYWWVAGLRSVADVATAYDWIRAR